MDLTGVQIWGLALTGAAMGILGGIIGTWATIHNADGPKEKALAYKFAAGGFVYTVALLAWFVIIPSPYALLFHIPNIILVMQIPRANKMFMKAREADRQSESPIAH